jgi:hypothetical protein
LLWLLSHGRSSCLSALFTPTPFAHRPTRRVVSQTIFSATGKFSQCRYKAEAKYLKSLDRPKRVADSAKCSTKLDSSIAKAYEKYGNACPSRARTQAALRGTFDVGNWEDTSDMVEWEFNSDFDWMEWQLVEGAGEEWLDEIFESEEDWSLGGGDDIPRIIVSPTPNMQTTESGNATSFTVALKHAAVCRRDDRDWGRATRLRPPRRLVPSRSPPQIGTSLRPWPLKP